MPGSWQPTTFITWAFTLIIPIIVHRCWFHLGSRHPAALHNSSAPPATKFKRKALLIGIVYQHESGGYTEGPLSEVLSMRQLLIDGYHYDPHDIVMLINNNKPDQMQPTRDNMIQKMNDLVNDAHQGDRFFFYFVGQAIQEASKDVNEEDKYDELILTCDDEALRDKELFQLLAKPLPIGSTLVTIFDCSHSGSLLNLKHFRCNGVYVPWLNRGQRHTDFWHNIVVRKNAQQDVAQMFSIQTPTPSYLVTSPSPIEWYGTPESPILRCDSPESVYCDGRCRETVILQHDIGLDADIICLSSAKEDQLIWEQPRSSMTWILIKILEKNLNPSLKDLLTGISHELHANYLELHSEARFYKKAIAMANLKRAQKGRQPWASRQAEMNNFQEPQISSPLPLDMSRRWQL